MSVQIVYTIADKRGRTATTSVRVGGFLTAQNIDGFGNLWADAIDNLISGVIRAAVWLLQGDVGIFTTGENVAEVGGDVEEIGAFQFVTGDGEPVEINIPAFWENLVDNDSGEINQSATAVAAFITLMTEPFEPSVGDPFNATDVGGVAIDHVVYARERSRNTGKRV